jgi:hypothetical protein
MYVGLHVKCPLLVSYFNENLNFIDRFLKKKNVRISNFMKIGPVGAELFRADLPDGRTDKTKLIIAFRNFSNVPKKN